MDLAQADKQVHAVEDQWHYPIMIEHGYSALTAEGVGFVRSYLYTHPETNSRIKLTTGFSADYWEDLDTGNIGYWKELAPHIVSLKKISV